MYNPDDILLQAIYALNKKLEENHLDKLDLKICGGFAMYRFTKMLSRDIDNTFKLSKEIKDLVEQISEEFESGVLDDDWLNDDWGTFGSKSWQAIQVDKNIKWEPSPEIKLSRISITFATLDSLLCMKYFAIIERSKPKDLIDFKKMMENNNVSLEDFLKMLKEHGIKNDYEDIVANLFAFNLIKKEDYCRFFGI